jgi:tetratricopeptide (TPR) repeat protein
LEPGLKYWTIKRALLSTIIILFIGCSVIPEDELALLRENSTRISDVTRVLTPDEVLLKRNSINMEDGLPFYVLRPGSPLLYDLPSQSGALCGNFRQLKFGEVLLPVEKSNSRYGWFYVSTLDGDYGWIHYGSGISLNYSEDRNLYYFSDRHYLKHYRKSGGRLDSSNLIVLAKNVIPYLNGNFSSEGWFYPEDRHLALELARLVVSISRNKKTYFFSATAYDWRVHEIVISRNLLADCYQSLKMYDKAIETHEYLLRRYFWSYSDNTRVGGLNSIIKLEKIYLEKLAYVEPGSPEYRYIEDKIVSHILKIGNHLNIYTVMDHNWHRTAAEWTIFILMDNLPSDDFYRIAEHIRKKTSSDGYRDLILIYIALKNYNDGKHEEAMEILSKIKPRKKFKYSLKIDDWLAANRIVPDSIIYQYKF